MNTSLDNLTHKMQRAALGKIVDVALSRAEQDREKTMCQLVDAAKQFYGSGFSDETYENAKKVLTDPDSKWTKLINCVLDQTDPHVARTTALNLGYEAFFRGTKMIRENRVKYQCNIPWLILFDPTSACNMHCVGCWAGEYGHKNNLSFEDMDKIVTQGKELGVYLYMLTGGEPLADLNALQRMLDTIPATHKIYINTTFPAQATISFEEMLAFTERNKDKITCMNISRHLVKYVEESPDEILGRIACPTRINCVLYRNYPASKLVDYVERFLPYRIPIQFRYDYTETTPENLYEEEHDKILQDLKKQFTYKGLDGCRMRNGFHFEYKGLHMTYHKTLPYSTIVEKGDDGVTYDILYDILIKQNGEIHSDWTGVKMDVDAYRRVVFEPYDLKVLNGTIDF